MACKEGCARVVLEGNAQSMIKAIPNPSTTPYWSINAIIEDICVTLNSFVCWNASFVFKDSKGMFGNCFFSLFFVSKNNFLILRLKNLFGNLKWTKNKNCSQNSICEGNWKHVNSCFQFLIFKSEWKHVFNLMNLSHLMS